MARLRTFGGEGSQVPTGFGGGAPAPCRSSASGAAVHGANIKTPIYPAVQNLSRSLAWLGWALYALVAGPVLWMRFPVRKPCSDTVSRRTIPDTNQGVLAGLEQRLQRVVVKTFSIAVQRGPAATFHAPGHGRKRLRAVDSTKREAYPSRAFCSPSASTEQ